MTMAEVATAAAAVHLTPLGGFHDEGGTTILLGPLEPGFWGFVTGHPAFHGPDPLDHWSDVTITALADELDAEACFPFGGPPYHPFIAWALRSGEAWQSPVGLLVHKDAGLLVSYRGALRFDRKLDLPAPAPRPCDTCAGQPCRTACPVSALGPGGYDVPLCKTHIDTDPVCRAACRVRMACPVSQRYGRDQAQTAYHMEVFHPSCPND
nr:ferredoxin [Thalassorhabdomicrobium marinisediminis]